MVNVVIPRNLNDEQRELLERFADTLGPHNLDDEVTARCWSLRACVPGDRLNVLQTMSLTPSR